MALKGFQRNFPALKILSPGQEELIHQGTLKVLARTGIVFHDEPALRLLADHGCEVDFSTHRVKFPGNLVEKAVSQAPSNFRVKARDPENDIILGQPNVTYFSSSPGNTTLDLDTWEPREPTRKEFYDYVTVLDALPHVHRVSGMPYFGFAKVPQCLRFVESCAAKIRNSTKVHGEGAILDNARWTLALGKVTGQEILNYANPAAPLTYYENTISAIRRYIESDIPFHLASGPVAGATAPATLAGALITNNAETLAGIALAQWLKPGTRVWAGNMTMVQNMRTGSPAFGSIANSLNEVCFNQMWQRYEIPTWSSSSAWTSSKAIDFQAAYEMSMAALACALSGASVVLLHGGLTGELTAHPVKAILDDDIAGMIGRFLRGVEVNEETMALDLIDQVGPIPGNFLLTAHTRQRWKQEQFLPRVGDGSLYPDWVQSGGKKAFDHARERMEEILSTHKAPPLPAEQEQAVEDILKDARSYYRKKGMISDEEWTLYQEDLGSPNYPYA